MVKDNVASFLELIEHGDKYFSSSSYQHALNYFEKALLIEPAASELLYKIGFCYLQSSNHLRSRAYFENSLHVDATHEKSNLNLGFVSNLLGDIEKAIHYFQTTCHINPSNFASNYNLGIAYFNQKNVELSKKFLHRAAHLNPLSHEVAYNLGVISNQVGNHAQAVKRYLQSIAIEPSQCSSFFNLGVSYFELSNPQKAIDSYRLALIIDSEHIQSHWNLSHCLLLVDDYKNGFLEYEWRWKQNESFYQQKQRSFASDLWLGQTPLNNKTLLIYAEQGFGDTLQFIRFCKHPALKNASLIVEVQKDLVSLIQSSLPNIKVIGSGQEFFESDFHIPLMSLPLALGISNPFSIDSRPYIHPSERTVEDWRVKTSIFQKPRVGLVWSSGYRKEQEETWEANKKRNLQLLSLHFLKEFDACFFTLQKGFIPQSEFASLMSEKWGGPSLIDFTEELTDFEQTAALISQLDLIITVDTSVAHLAGAMGKQTLLMLKFNADWRWHHLSESSIWYPNTKIFRQSKPSDWEVPLQQLRQFLRSIIVTTDYIELL
jgi:tetratricopeptide (TPR) repeat protein